MRSIHHARCTRFCTVHYGSQSNQWYHKNVYLRTPNARHSCASYVINIPNIRAQWNVVEV